MLRRSAGAHQLPAEYDLWSPRYWRPHGGDGDDIAQGNAFGQQRPVTFSNWL